MLARASADRTLNSTFAALADPTRRAILARLASGEASVAELARPFAMSQPAISKHLKVLERAGLDFTRPRCAAPAAPARGQVAGRGDEVSGTLPPILGRELPASRRAPRGNEDRAETQANQAIREITDADQSEKRSEAQDHDALRSRDRDDTNLRCATQHGVRCVDQARAHQTLAGSVRRLGVSWSARST